MGAKRSLAGLLALALLGSPYASPVQAEEPELERAVADAIRFSIGRQTTTDEVRFAARHYRDVVSRLRALAPAA